MFSVNDDMSIYVTRGDTAFFGVTADNNGTKYKFQPGEVVRFKVTEKKACENVAFYKDFPITEETERVEILLAEDDTKIGDVISKPTEYWYEVELNPYTNPQTILGYDDDGPKVFKLFPEGDDKDEDKEPINPEDIPVVDEVDMLSPRPVKNRAIARAIVAIQNLLNTTVARFNNLVTLEPGSTTGDAEIADIRVGIDNTIYPRAGDAVREQIRDLTGYVNERVEILDANLASAEENARKAAASAEEAAISASEAEESSNGIKEAEAAAKESEENAKYYYEQAQRISESFSGALKPGGTITFAQLLALETVAPGDMYNISDEFITTDEFKEGSGTVIPLGANVYRTGDGYWDVLAGSPVTGIKGDKENTYRRGNVNITPAQIGALTDKELRETILDTMEEIEANTQENQLAGALAVKELSEDVTTRFEGVVAKADVIDNLESTETKKPLSANQGRMLKKAIDENSFGDWITNSEGITFRKSSKRLEAYSNLSLNGTPIPDGGYTLCKITSGYEPKHTVYGSGTVVGAQNTIYAVSVALTPEGYLVLYSSNYKDAVWDVKFSLDVSLE